MHDLCCSLTHPFTRPHILMDRLLSVEPHPGMLYRANTFQRGPQMTSILKTNRQSELTTGKKKKPSGCKCCDIKSQKQARGRGGLTEHRLNAVRSGVTWGEQQSQQREQPSKSTKWDSLEVSEPCGSLLPECDCDEILKLEF